MRTIGVVTVARSDYGIYQSVLRMIEDDPDLRLRLFVTGMHLSPEYGMTVKEIEKDGFDIAERVEMLLSSDTPAGVAASMGMGTVGFAQAFSRFKPDILLVLGDRFEMHAAVVASLPFKIPVAHIHGGESTEGAIDESLRHSITKMSHLHFASTQAYANRIEQMGENPWRVLVSGAPALDNLRRFSLLGRDDLKKQHGLEIDDCTLLVTFHPVTLQYEQTENHMTALLDALDNIGLRVVFTYPNADTQGRLIVEMIRGFAEKRSNVQVAVNLGIEGYFSLMNQATAMIGNSSSGVIEAASFKLPVVNIGDRQRGRHHSTNVIDVGYGKDEILAGINTAIDPEFTAGLADLENPYGDGLSAERIVNRLKEVELDDVLLLKSFHDLSDSRVGSGNNLGK